MYNAAVRNPLLTTNKEVKHIGKNTKNCKAKSPQIIQPQALSKDWIPFSQRLASTLEKLEEDQFLILTKKQSNEFIQIVCQGSFGTRLETISNFFRDASCQLTEAQIAKLLQLGWSQPTGDQVYGSEQYSPDGSPNYFADSNPPHNFAALADFVIKTFNKVLHISHPGFLEYACFDGAGNSISLPELGLKRADAVHQKEALPQLIIDTITEVTGLKDWAFDEENHLGGIVFGNATTNIQLLDDQQYIRIYSIILEGVKESLQLLARINELNLENGYMHLILKDGVVIALSDLQVIPFVNNHLVNCLGNFCQTVDGMHDILNAEFGGGASFVEQPTTTH